MLLAHKGPCQDFSTTWMLSPADMYIQSLFLILNSFPTSLIQPISSISSATTCSHHSLHSLITKPVTPSHRLVLLLHSFLQSSIPHYPHFHRCYRACYDPSPGNIHSLGTWRGMSINAFYVFLDPKKVLNSYVFFNNITIYNNITIIVISRLRKVATETS